MEALCLPGLPQAALGGSPLTQVLGLGLAWTFLHCAGMCGPLIAGLGFGQAGPTRRILLAVVDLGLYQSGRALVYAGLGAGAGLAGASLAHLMHTAMPIVALTVGLLFTAVVLHRLYGRPTPAAGRLSILARWAGRLAQALVSHPRVRAFLLGMILAFLPCMLMFWVLSLAALSASPLQGALIMVTLVGMTVPVLLAAAIAPLAIGAWRRRAARVAGTVPLALSASWLLCIALAGFGVVPHAGLRIGSWVVMLW